MDQIKLNIGSKPLVLAWGFLLFALCTFGQSPIPKNIVIDSGPAAFGPEEPSILIHQKDPSKMVAAANINRLYVSSDTGNTWKKIPISSSMGVYGDPCLVGDKKGNTYFFHLSNPEGTGWASPKLLDRIVCQRSKDFGRTWNDGSGIGENHPKDQDKEWAVVNPDNGHIYITWTQFDLYASKEAKDSTLILFSKSKNKGRTWSTPTRINEVAGNCIDSDSTVEGAVPAVGANGEIYVCWAVHETLYFDRSLDGGKTWLSSDIRVAKIAGGWDLKIPGINRCNGMPVTKVDLSGGEFHGRIYVNWADQTQGLDNTDIWIVYSDDQGSTWSKPVRVNQDNSNRHQFFTWMDIDQATGGLYLVYYDRRNYADLNTDVVLAWSRDGGITFEEKVISESPFSPTDEVFFGDYNNISAHNGLIRPIWTRLEKDTLSILTAIINLK
ncbi:MAG: hypothetical protein ACI9YL_000288 [Luteibaculaceae bacterium]|jgi:hypothetical protein